MKFFNLKIFKKEPNAPWVKYYKETDINLEIKDVSLYNYFEEKALKFGNIISLDYYGHKVRYQELIKKIDDCAKGLYYYGIKKGDVVTICLPNTLEGVVAFFSINKIGAIANFIHPASSENEIMKSINNTNSKIIILIDSNYWKIENILKKTKLKKIILININHYMPFINKLRYHKNKIKIKFAKNNKLYLMWDDFIERTKNKNKSSYTIKGNKSDPAVILHSGGTTGIPKGVVLSNENLIAFIESVSKSQSYLQLGDTCLALMPIFHGFGLVHSIIFPLTIGMNVVLRPKFEIIEYCSMIKKYKPQILMGVPTLFEALLTGWNSDMKLDFLKCVLVGGDTLKEGLRDKINKFLKEHGANIKVSAGYGLSEAVCGVSLEDPINQKEGTIGIPIPGIYVGIFSKADLEVPYNEPGEICICGPTVMLGYYNNEKETNIALHVHKDGNIWLHTGDIGSMDENGFITFINRSKRIIISSGYNVYPNQIEKLLETHPSVMLCTVVGIPHKRKIEVPKAYIVLNKKHKKKELVTIDLMMLCKKNLPKYAWPTSYEYAKSLPTTKVGKIDFKKLQENRKNDE